MKQQQHRHQKNDKKLVNFQKLMMIADIILMIREFQNRPFGLNKFPKLQQELQKPRKLLTKKEAFALSKECEPLQPN